jgi:hypothetical protein
MKPTTRLAFLFVALAGLSISAAAPDLPGQAPPDSLQPAAGSVPAGGSQTEDAAVATEESASGGVFRPLDVPSPGEFRTAAGAPNASYWQQDVSYEIKVALDPEAHRITGSEKVTYTNNSPDSLSSIWLQLDQNLFRPESRGAERAARMEEEAGDVRFQGMFEGGGYDIERVAVIRDEVPLEVPFEIDGTMMEIHLDRPVQPVGGELEIEVDFAFTIPESGADRMGRLKVKKGTVYELAQWYPRVFVYDDVNGWNALPYLGQGEFYLEFGDFDVEITVPRDFIVAATGELQNPEEVLTADQLQRLELAGRSAATVPIVEKGHVGKEEYRPIGTGPLTWKFHAKDVRDFAWAGSKAFIWDAGSWDGILAMSFYPEEGLGAGGRGPPIPGWEMSTEYVLHALEFYSQWYRYPYPVAINVAGTALGMEYPMIVFCSVEARGLGLFLVTDHEIAHTWFPMVVGSDERRYAWMDEGFNTFMNHYSLTDYGGTDAWPADPVLPRNSARLTRSEDLAKPIMTAPDDLSESQLGFLGYTKPGMVLYLLREYVLGPAVFDAGFTTYIERWAYKHPQPADFFRTMEDVSGEDLNWYWNSWLYGNGYLDQAVTNVARQDGNSTVTIRNRGDAVMPMEVRFVFRDGTDECRRLPVDIWRDGDAYTVEFEGKNVRTVHIDPRGMLPDANRSNNVHGRGVVTRIAEC